MTLAKTIQATISAIRKARPRLKLPCLLNIQTPRFSVLSVARAESIDRIAQAELKRARPRVCGPSARQRSAVHSEAAAKSAACDTGPESDRAMALCRSTQAQ